ncbi:MAG TPA: hypothetical protein VF103_09630 [Polyangiaceae bacterium]
MKSTSLFAVLIGSGVGVIAAIGGRAKTGKQPPPPLPPVAAQPLAEPAASARLPARPPAERTAPAPAATAQDTLAETETPIGSPEDFQAAAIACDEKDAGACLRAATAVELGAVVPKDPERAKTFRRVELTILVRGCEKGAVDSCLTLADRYLRGDGLARNERTALALVAHTRDLCSRHPEPACRNVPRD